MAKKKSSSSAAAEKKRKHESPLTQQQMEKDTTTRSDNKQRRQKRKSKQALKDEAEERRLTAMLFGGGSTVGQVDVDFGNNDEGMMNDANHHQDTQNDITNEDEEESPSLLFEIDRTGADDGAPKEENGQQEHHDEGEVNDEHHYHQDQDSEDSDSDDDDDDNSQDNKPAWIDEDDDDVEVNLLGTDRLRKLRTSRSEDTKAQPLSGTELQQRLRARYKSTMQVNAQTGWARLDDEDKDNDKNINEEQDQDDDAAALQSSSQPLLLQGSANSGRLPPNILNVVRCPDANQSDYNQAVVQAVQFHPGSDPNRPLLLTAGLDKTLRFFQVGSEKSEKIHGIHCKYRTGMDKTDYSDDLMELSACYCLLLLCGGSLTLPSGANCALQSPNFPFTVLPFWVTLARSSSVVADLSFIFTIPLWES